MTDIIVSERFIEGANRYQAALNCVPDRVPISAQIHEHARLLAGVEPVSFYSNARLFLKIQLAVSDYYELDVPSTVYDGYNIEAEALGQKLIWTDETMPTVDSTRPLLSKKSDLLCLHPPDFEKAGRMPFVLETHRIAKEIGLTMPALFCAPFSLAVALRGMENLIIDILEDSNFVHELLEFLTVEVIAPWIKKQRDTVCEDIAAIGGDALASLPLTNIKILEEFALPYSIKLQEMLGNITIGGWWGERYLKSQDDIRKMIDLKIRANSDLVQAYDPDIHEIGLDIFKEMARKSGIGLHIGFSATLLSSGKPEEIVQRMRSYLAQIPQEGKTVIRLNEITAGTPVKNVFYAVRAAKVFGAYPIDTSRWPDSFEVGRIPRFAIEL
jgi:uroporphyrinogen-III decarboxylase